jgi:hypothetical protein
MMALRSWTSGKAKQKSGVTELEEKHDRKGQNFRETLLFHGTSVE